MDRRAGAEQQAVATPAAERVVEPPPSGSRRWKPWALDLVVGSAAVVTYLNALGGAFVWDAYVLIARNPSLLGSKRWLVWFTRDYYWGSGVQGSWAYRPLTILSFLLHIRTTGVSPLPFLLGNVLLHAAVSVLVWRLGRRLVGELAALVGALIFAVHPLHTEAVAAVVGRAELLGALFALAACLGCLAATDAGARHRGWLAAGTVLAYLAALLSKESVAPLPLWFGLVWLLDRRRRSGRVMPALGIGCAAALGLVLVLWANVVPREILIPFPPGLFNPAGSVAAPLRWLTAAAAVWRYALLFVWPGRLSIDYSYAETVASTGVGPSEAAGLLVIVAILAGAAIAARRAPGLALALAMTPIAFVVASNFPFRIGTLIGERLMYLPSVGGCLATGWLLTRLLTPAAARREVRWRGFALAAVVAGVTVPLAARAVVRNRDWKDGYTLARATLRASPRSATAHVALANIEFSRGNHERAMELVQESIRIYPHDPMAMLLLGHLYVDRQDYHGGEQEYRKGLALAPRDPTLRFSLGIALLRSGRPAEGERELREAIRIMPGFAAARQRLGRLLLDTGRAAEALGELQSAERLSPRDPSVLYDIASAALALGDRPRASTYARRAAAAGFRVPPELWESLGASDESRDSR